MSASIDQMAAMTDEDFLKMEVPSDTPAAEPVSEAPVAEQPAPVVEQEAPVTEQPVEEVPTKATVTQPADQPAANHDKSVDPVPTDKVVEPQAKNLPTCWRS